MSTELPPNASLEHLKKQAKARLRELQQADPAAQLADAQHKLARQYGFASWPRLKARLESIAAHPFTGTWTANLSNSVRHPLNPFQSASLRVSVVGDTITIDDAVVDESGRREERRHTIHADGVERRFEHGYALVARWRGERVLETIATQHGQIVGRGTYQVSDDGATLTIANDEQTIVLDRLD